MCQQKAQQVGDHFGGKTILVELMALFPKFHGAGRELFALHGAVEHAVLRVVAEFLEQSSQSNKRVSVFAGTYLRGAGWMKREWLVRT